MWSALVIIESGYFLRVIWKLDEGKKIIIHISKPVSLLNEIRGTKTKSNDMFYYNFSSWIY